MYLQKYKTILDLFDLIVKRYPVTPDFEYIEYYNIFFTNFQNINIDSVWNKLYGYHFQNHPIEQYLSTQYLLSKWIAMLKQIIYDFK